MYHLEQFPYKIQTNCSLWSAGVITRQLRFFLPSHTITCMHIQQWLCYLSISLPPHPLTETSLNSLGAANEDTCFAVCSACMWHAGIFHGHCKTFPLGVTCGDHHVSLKAPPHVTCWHLVSGGATNSRTTWVCWHRWVGQEASLLTFSFMLSVWVSFFIVLCVESWSYTVIPLITFGLSIIWAALMQKYVLWIISHHEEEWK